MGSFLESENQQGIAGFIDNWDKTYESSVKIMQQVSDNKPTTLVFEEQYELHDALRIQFAQWGMHFGKYQILIQLLRKYPNAQYGNRNYSQILNSFNSAQQGMDEMSDYLQKFDQYLKAEMGPFHYLERLIGRGKLPLTREEKAICIDYRYSNLAKFIITETRQIEYEKINTKGFSTDDSGYLMLTKGELIFKGKVKQRRYDLNDELEIELFESRVLIRSSNYKANHYYEVSRSSHFITTIKKTRFSVDDLTSRSAEIDNINLVVDGNGENSMNNFPIDDINMKLKVTAIDCPSCGTLNPETSKFCIECGINFP